MKEHVCQHLQEIRQRIDSAPALALFLDFDGTLVPIADHPDQVFLNDAARHRLQELSACPDFLVAVISGRELIDLQRRVGLADIVYAGNHGLEISGPNCAFVEPTVLEHRTALRELTGNLVKRLRDIPGAWVENKVLTASVHFRNAAEDSADEVRKLVHGALAGACHPFQLTSGDKVYDIRPRVYWNKGHAVGWIRAQAAAPGALALYVGNDNTDEDAFAALPEDITVKVGAAPQTMARFYLENVAEVHEFLGWLADERSTSGLNHPRVN
jgi:trehalose 6-phosphate phosphatase